MKLEEMIEQIDIRKEKVIEQLKEWDDVAYVRFASVYRQFKDINEFMTELKDLLDERRESED